MKRMKNNDIELTDNPDANNLSNILTTSKIAPSLQDILISLISDKSNITLKTEIHNPLALTLIKMFGGFFERKGYTITANYIEMLINTYLEYMVSNKRKSRKEVIKALSSWMEKYDVNNQGNLTISE